MPTPLTPAQRDLVAEFGSIYEQYGFQRIKGLLVGLLLVQPDPLSLDDMADMLARSKGPISTAVRDLATTGLVRKVDGPNRRRDYYAAHPDLFLNNFKHNMAIVRKNRRTAEQFLEEMNGSEVHAEAVRNLNQMRAFYTLMESFYEDFAERWEAEAAGLDGRA